MKRKIFGTALIAAMALAAGWNFNQSKNEVELSDLALANVEALARDEGVEIMCGQRQGQCWTTDYNRFYNCGEYTMVHPCTFTGSMSDSCYDPCKR